MRGRTWRVQNDDDANQDLLSCSRHGRECTTLVLAYSWLGTWAQPGALYFPLNSCPGSFITFANHSTVIDADGDGSLPLHILLVLRLMDVFKVKQKKKRTKSTSFNLPTVETRPSSAVSLDFDFRLSLPFHLPARYVIKNHWNATVAGW